MTNIREEEELGIVLIGTQEIEGFVDDHLCTECTRPQIYSNKHDSYFCAFCNVWLEPVCSDPECSYCPGRPATPLE